MAAQRTTAAARTAPRCTALHRAAPRRAAAARRTIAAHPHRAAQAKAVAAAGGAEQTAKHEEHVEDAQAAEQTAVEHADVIASEEQRCKRCCLRCSWWGRGWAQE